MSVLSSGKIPFFDNIPTDLYREFWKAAEDYTVRG